MTRRHTVVQGSDYSIRVPLLLDCVEISTEGWQFAFEVRSAPLDVTSPALISRTTANGGILPYNTTSVYVDGRGEDTASLEPGIYLYGIKATHVDSGRKEVLERGEFEISDTRNA